MPNNFEQWKAALTLDEAIAMAERMDTCAACPAIDFGPKPGCYECPECFRAWAEGNTDRITANTGAANDSTGAKVMTDDQAALAVDLAAEVEWLKVEAPKGDFLEAEWFAGEMLDGYMADGHEVSEENEKSYQLILSCIKFCQERYLPEPPKGE